jgi:hypothetical protein
MQLAPARKLARAVPGIDVVVAGDEVGDGADAEQVGDAVLLRPAAEAQKVARLELHIVGGVVSTKLFADDYERKRQVERLDRKIALADKDLERFAADPNADPAFVKARRDERERMVAERDKRKAETLTPPAGSYAVASLVPVRRRIARDPALAAAMKELDAKVGEANRLGAANTPPPKAAKGSAHFVGMDACEDCHAAAVELWKSTVHAQAWDELVKVNKQWSYDCIGCHVTGYGKAGGSAMAHVDKLESVQCEVCHGPGSLHAAKPKKEKLRFPTEADCKGCHTPEHSDTFQYTAYLRDILGKGHGEATRVRLGEGPTGHELRHGAQERAKEATE